MRKNGENNQDGLEYNCNLELRGGRSYQEAECPAASFPAAEKCFCNAAVFQGTPMIFQGDEWGNSQKGNNNAWCQDNEIGWVDWRGMKKK